MQAVARKKKSQATVEVMESRILELLAVLAFNPGISPARLHSIYCPRWNVKWQAVDWAMRHARARLIAESGKSRDEHRRDTLGALNQIIADDNSTHGERIKAIEKKCDMLGLDDPTRITVELPVESEATYGNGRLTNAWSN